MGEVEGLEGMLAIAFVELLLVDAHSSGHEESQSEEADSQRPAEENGTRGGFNFIGHGLGMGAFGLFLKMKDEK